MLAILRDLFKPAGTVVRTGPRLALWAQIFLILNPLNADQNYPVPIAITPLKLSANHISSAGDPGYTSAMNDGVSAPELVFIRNRAYLIWNDNELNGRISLLSPDLSRVERDLVRIQGRRIADGISNGNSIALLTLEWHRTPKGIEDHTAHIETYSSSGGRQFSARIVGTKSYDREGDQGIDTIFGTFNLAWSGKHYATYFNTYRKWDDGIVHQSEYLALFDSQGSPVEVDGRPVGWTWNVSHSFRPRMAWDGKRFLMSTVGDAYPRGLVVQSLTEDKPGKFSTDRATAIQVPKAGPGETYQYVVISTGDVYGENGNGWVVFDSRLGRKDYDIGLMRTVDGKAQSPVWITNTPGIRERIPRIQPLGDDLLVVWAVDKTGKSPDKSWHLASSDVQTRMAVIKKDGSVRIAPFDVPAGIRGANRLFRYPNGDVGWINDLTREGNKLEIVRISSGESVITDQDETTDLEESTESEENNTNQEAFDPSLSLPLLQNAYRGDATAVKSFLAKGADPNSSYEGWYALHYGAYYGHLDVCRFLLDAGANPNHLVDGWSPLRLAEHRGHSQIAELLKPVSSVKNRSARPLPEPGNSLSLEKKHSESGPSSEIRKRKMETKKELPGPPRAMP